MRRFLPVVMMIAVWSQGSLAGSCKQALSSLEQRSVALGRALQKRIPNHQTRAAVVDPLMEAVFEATGVARVACQTPTAVNSDGPASDCNLALADVAETGIDLGRTFEGAYGGETSTFRARLRSLQAEAIRICGDAD